MSRQRQQPDGCSTEAPSSSSLITTLCSTNSQSAPFSLNPVSMFGALSAHYRKEEEQRLAQLERQRLQKQQLLLQQQRAAAAAAASNNNNKLQPAYGQYLSRYDQNL